MVEGSGLKNMAKKQKLVNQQRINEYIKFYGSTLSKARETLDGMNLPSMGEMNKLLKKLHLNIYIYMARKCPGVICIENMTIIFLIIVVVLFGIYIDL